MPFIHTEIHDKVAWVTLTRPEKLNALSSEVLRELDAAFAALEHDPKTGVIILTGAGDRAFAAGADIAEIRHPDSLAAQQSSLEGQAIYSRIEAFPKPVIAAVNGWALGSGCELAVACHIRVASEEAHFGLPEVSLGTIPGYGGTQRLPRLVGKGVALDMILTGEPISASEALAVGLVSRVFPALDLKAGAEKMARTILTRGPLAVRVAISTVIQGMNAPLEIAVA